MTTEGEVSVEERILQLLHHLGIRQAHFAASNLGDWRGLAEYHSEVISSLTLVSPRAIDSSVLGPLAPRLLVFNGDQGSSAAAVISNCPQTRNPVNAYNPTPIRLIIWEPDNTN